MIEMKIVGQDCQIYLGTIYQNGQKIPQVSKNYTKWPQNYTKDHKICKMATKLYQMTTEYTKWP
jgi:hypothetical protein